MLTELTLTIYSKDISDLKRIKRNMCIKLDESNICLSIDCNTCPLYRCE